MRVVEGTLDVEDIDGFVAKLGEIESGTGAAVQAFDARYVSDRAHLESAVVHANRAFDRGENIARERSVEILLYAAGRRQISRALEMGVSDGENAAVVVVDGGKHEDGDEATAAEGVEALDAYTAGETLGVAADEDRITEFYEISATERDATTAGLSALVRERVALLDVEK